MMKKISALILVYLLLVCNSIAVGSEENDIEIYDVIVYGGTSSGIAAAIQVSRLKKSVIVIEPSGRIGGLTTGGLGQTDIGHKQVIGGIAREFYQNIRKYYSDTANWKWQNQSEYNDGGQTRTREDEDAMWTFEPSAALKVFNDMVREAKVKVVYNQRLNRSSGIRKLDNLITSIQMESGDLYRGRVFIDATYEGDLLAAAGVSYSVGRESKSQYGESLNGVQDNLHGVSLLGNRSLNSINHNFVDGVDPYIIEGNKESGLLPFIDPKGPGKSGKGDHRVQAYCFRMCLTDHPANRIPFSKPDGYDELEYELLFRNYEMGFDKFPWINSQMPNRKTDTNNRHGFSTDFIGQNYAYPEASYEERKGIIERHRQYQKGLMWSLAYHPRIPEHIRKEVSKWGTCKDEFERDDGWPNQLYIREARRMIGEYVMTQKNCEGINTISDPIGMAAYGMDSHMVQRYIDENGHVKNEGNIQSGVKPYPISYRSIVPKRKESSNLLVPVCLSASHIAFGSIRMEPVFMILGQSAAIAASIAIDRQEPVQDIPYEKLRDGLMASKQILSQE